MVELRVPTLDFSPLGNLPKVYRAAQNDAAKRMTLDQLGRGEIDQETATQRLLSVDPQMGLTLAQLSNNQRDFQFRQQQADQAQRNADRAHSLQERALMQKTDGIDAQVAQRERAAQRLGIDPSHPAYNSFVLTGRMPREDQAPLTATDKKAILDADEAILTNKTVIGNLEEAKKLSPQTYAGAGSGVRTWIGNNLPDGLVLDALSSPEKAGATANYENLVLGQALNSLKSIFGAAPTEGERKILVDLQASVGKPDNVRQAILDRAIGLANNRLKFNEQRAGELRGGTYYKSQGGQSASSAAPARGGITREQYNALPSGSTYTAPDGSQRVKP